MPTLWNWYLEEDEGGILAHGIVSGHTKLPDGLHIHTSRLEKVWVEGERLVLNTVSGSEYVLEPEGISPRFGGETAVGLAHFGVGAEFTERCLRLRAERDEGEEAELLRTLAPGELLIEIVGINALRAWFRADGDNVVGLKPDVHLGMFQDSILLWDREGGSVDFRYFPKGDRMEPYHVSDGLKIIKIRNLGGTDVRFGHSDSEVICPAGETTAIPAADHDREGLFSPDVVNGKGLYRSLSKEEEKKDTEDA